MSRELAVLRVEYQEARLDGLRVLQGGDVQRFSAAADRYLTALETALAAQSSVVPPQVVYEAVRILLEHALKHLANPELDEDMLQHQQEAAADIRLVLDALKRYTSEQNPPE